MEEEFQTEWIQQAKEDNQEAFSKLYQCSYTTVYLTVRLQIKDNEDAVLDIVQNTYVKAFSALDQLRDEKKFIPWIRTIARRSAIDWLRKNKPLLLQVSSLDDEGIEEIEFSEQREYQLPEENLNQQETRYLMRQLLNTLSSSQRLAISLYYYENMSIQEISEITGCTSGTIKGLLYQGREKLKSKIQDLKDRGFEVYGLAPMPLFLLLLRSWSKLSIAPDNKVTTTIFPQSIADNVLARSQITEMQTPPVRKLDLIHKIYSVKKGIITVGAAAIIFSCIGINHFLPNHEHPSHNQVWNTAPLVPYPKQPEQAQKVVDVSKRKNVEQIENSARNDGQERTDTTTIAPNTLNNTSTASEPKEADDGPETEQLIIPTRDIMVKLSDQVWVVDVPAHDGEVEEGGFDMDDEEEDSFLPAYVYCTVCGFKIPYNESVQGYQTEDGIDQSSEHKRRHGRDICTGGGWKYSDEPYLKHYEEEGHYETLTLNQGNLNLRIGQTAELSVNITPALEDQNSMKWNSDSPEVATVENGIVTGISRGQAAITATTPHGAKVVAAVTIEG